MFVFPDELRKAYEAVPIPQVFYQFVDGKVVPLLVSDGFCRLVGMGREETMKWLVGGQFERMHPDVQRWRLDTIEEEAGNCHLYEKIGYRRTGENKVINEKMTLIFYEKEKTGRER